MAALRVNIGYFLQLDAFCNHGQCVPIAAGYFALEQASVILRVRAGFYVGRLIEIKHAARTARRRQYALGLTERKRRCAALRYLTANAGLMTAACGPDLRNESRQ
jgi:hypothetical protein